MIVTDREYFINGNSALVPEKKRSSEEYEKLNKQKREHLQKVRRKKHLRQARIMLSITLTFTVGLTIVFRYAQIYSMQKQLSSYSRELDNLNKDKEDLKVDLVKCGNLQNIEKKALEQFHMVQPVKTQAVFVDLSKNNFKDIKKDDKKEINNGVLNKLKSMFF